MDPEVKEFVERRLRLFEAEMNRRFDEVLARFDARFARLDQDSARLDATAAECTRKLKGKSDDNR